MNTTGDEFERIQANYAAAVFAKDVDELLSLYAPQARVFDAWDAWCHDGAAAWRRVVEGWLGSLGTERLRVKFHRVETWEGEPCATLSALVSYTALSEQGDPMRSMHNRITWVLQRIDGRLRIVHEHTSAPIRFEDMKAMLSATDLIDAR